MKKLQQNFTTTEQSKRLLELGVPADSADCYINEICNNRAFQLPDIFSKCTWLSEKKPIPCWSAGRLMEIYLTCALEYHPYDDFYTETPSLHLMAFDKNRLIEKVIEIMSEDEMDFSKLEE